MPSSDEIKLKSYESILADLVQVNPNTKQGIDYLKSICIVLVQEQVIFYQNKIINKSAPLREL